MTTDTSLALLCGYNAPAGDDCPHLWSSTLWECWQVGRWLHATGRTVGGVRKSRGSTFVGPAGHTFRLTYGKAGAFNISREA